MGIPTSPSDSWFYADDNREPVGPVSAEELKQLVTMGTLSLNTYVIEEGGTKWKLFSEISNSLPVTRIATPTLNPSPKKTDVYQAPGVLIEAKGKNGTIQLLEDKIRIKRNNQRLLTIMTQGISGDREIFLSQISSIQYKPAGIAFVGYIQFTFMGGQEVKGGLLAAVKDPNTVTFELWSQENFQALKEAIEKRLSVIRSGSERVAKRSPSPLDELEKLAQLRDRGIVTAAEFEEKKRQLLGLGDNRSK